MKKFVFAILLCFFGLNLEAQTVVTPDGLKFENDATFLVYDIENKAKETIYNNILLYVSQKYVSPKDVISKNENESITINAIADIVVGETNVGGKLIKSWNSPIQGRLNYTIAILFKDNKLRVNIPNVNSIWLEDNKIYLQGNNFGAPSNAPNVFNNKQKLTNPILKKSLEDFFNNFIKEIVTNARGENQDSNW